MDCSKLAQRPGDKEKFVVKEKASMIQRAEALKRIMELLLDILGGLSDAELQRFSLFCLRERHCKKTVKLMDVISSVVETYGEESVEESQKSLEAGMRFEAHLCAEIEKVSVVAAEKELLWKTLIDLKQSELERFKWFLQLTHFVKGLPHLPWSMLEFANRRGLVDLMWTKCEQKHVEVLREVLLDLDRSDLAQKLPEKNSGSGVKQPVEEFPPQVSRKAEELESETKQLLESLSELNTRDVRHFINILSHEPPSGPYLSPPCRLLSMKADLLHTVLLTVQMYSQSPRKKVSQVLRKMQMKGLAQKPFSKKKRFLPDERVSALIHKVALFAALKKEIFGILQNKNMFQRFQQSEHYETLHCRLDLVDSTAELASVFVEEFGRKSLVMEETKISLEDTSSGRTVEPPADPDLAACRKKEDSRGWTELDPEVLPTGADGAPTYRLQSEAGHFECRVSGLRWVCKEKVVFKYQFCCWKEPMERMGCRQYQPAGPLMDITVSTGRINQAYLPHWISPDDVPKLGNDFAVLHIKGCKEVVEKVSEVTATHVILTEPEFSFKGVLIRIARWFSPKVTCDTLIYYKPRTPSLKLHVYLIPLDPALQQSVHKTESSDGYKVIRKPRPDKYLQMKQKFLLKSTSDATITPKEITLQHNVSSPNFYEVYIERPDTKFILELLQTPSESVWYCEIRGDDHPTSGFVEAVRRSPGAAAVETCVKPPEIWNTSRKLDKTHQHQLIRSVGRHFVDRHRTCLIQRVSNVEPILDELLSERVISQEFYDELRKLSSQKQIRELLSGPVKSTKRCKDVFLEILQRHESFLIRGLMSMSRGSDTC